MRYVVYIFCLTVILALLYFVSSPLSHTHTFQDWFAPHKLDTYSDARNYYHIISSIVTSFAALFTVVLGAFYYFNKIDLDKIARHNEKARARLGEISNSVYLIDELCNKILLDSVNSVNELMYTRSRIVHHFDRIMAFFEADHACQFWSIGEKQVLIAFYSFVDNSNPISHSQYTNASPQQSDITGYQDAYREVVSIIQLKSVELN